MLEGEVISEAFAMGTKPIEVDGIVTPAEEAMCRRVLHTLDRHYPGHHWGAEVNAGLITIRNRALVGRWGYRVRYLAMTDTQLDAEVVRAGGEFLERYDQRRGRPNPDTLRAAKRDYRGHMVPSL